MLCLRLKWLQRPFLAPLPVRGNVFVRDGLVRAELNYSRVCTRDIAVQLPTCPGKECLRFSKLCWVGKPMPVYIIF